MRYIIVFVNALAAVIYQLIFGDPITATAKAPDNITPGQNFTVEVSIHKPQVAGFAKLQIELPADYVAAEGDSKGGNFSVSGSIAKIIWTAIPSDENMVVKINVTAPTSANGSKELTGKFSYIENNAKQQVDIAPVTLNMGGASSETQSNPVATTETTPTAETKKSEPTETTPATTSNSDNAQAFSQPTEPDAAVTINRQVTTLNVTNNFEITIVVQKGAVKGFAKLSEKVPDGFIATPLATADASFAFEDGIVKFIWASLPSAEQLPLTYKLTPDPNGGIQNPSVISGGTFSYIENNQTKKIALSQESLSTTPTEKVAGAVSSTNTSENNSTTVTENNETSNPSSETNSNTEVAAKETQSTTQASAPKNANIHYSVQIGAFKNGVNANSLKQKYGINEAVRTEMTEGFTKCIYGKFDEYKLARDSREVAKGKGVDGAFVTAYNSGKRITVQEALMVSNQKWYK